MCVFDRNPSFPRRVEALPLPSRLRLWVSCSIELKLRFRTHRCVWFLRLWYSRWIQSTCEINMLFKAFFIDSSVRRNFEWIECLILKLKEVLLVVLDSFLSSSVHLGLCLLGKMIQGFFWSKNDWKHFIVHVIRDFWYHHTISGNSCFLLSLSEWGTPADVKMILW